MKGFVTNDVICNHCGKRGHSEEKCWIKNPDKYPRKLIPKNNKTRCHKCGKTGHFMKDCRAKKKESNVLAAIKTNEKQCNIDCYMTTFIDSASSCHTVASLQLLDKDTIQTTDKCVKAVDGTLVNLTHKGNRIIRMREGTIRLGEVFYADDLQYNLISVPAMAEKGVKVTFAADNAFIEKSGNKITLREVDGLWALPEEDKTLKVASLRMEYCGSANARTWHQRLGHIGTKKTNKMIKNGEIPQIAAGLDAANCENCQLTHPRRRPVPKIAEMNGNITVQVDCMLMGQTEKGWKSEVGAYVYSSRSSKIVK